MSNGALYLAFIGQTLLLKDVSLLASSNTREFEARAS